MQDTKKIGNGGAEFCNDSLVCLRHIPRYMRPTDAFCEIMVLLRNLVLKKLQMCKIYLYICMLLTTND